MNHLPSTCSVALLCVLTVSSLSADEPARDRGFTRLFNGKDLTGWHGEIPSDPAQRDREKREERQAKIRKWTEEARDHWRVEEAQLIATGKGPALATDQDLADIELQFEFRLTGKARAQLQLRSSGTVLLNPPMDAEAGWQRCRLMQVGERLTVLVNDQRILNHVRLQNSWDSKKPLPRQGSLQLSVAGGEAKFRNFQVRNISAEEANKLLLQQGVAGFTEVFNGKDFTGWAGPLENYEVRDGAIVCKPKKGGNIYTKQEFSDFTVRLEYRVPPGGNNGLAIRYPGQGQASLVAMCEIQVLDDDAPKYAKLDPRQFNGSPYGMVPAVKGYQRPAGEWNVMEVTVIASRIEVELNGTRIVDADLATVTQFMGGKPHPGKDRKSGHFGFCGHNDPVAFRNIRIRKH